MEEGMMGQSSGQFVYHDTPGIVFMSQNNGSAILRPPFWEPAIKKVAKYGIGERSVRLVFANILKFVIDIPLHGKIFFACFSTSCVGIVSVTVSSSLFLINDNIYGFFMMSYYH
jgi:hypothetical protein